MEEAPRKRSVEVRPGERRARVERRTAETSVELELVLDGSGAVDVSTGIGFLDHMLTLFGRHGLFDLKVKAQGDLETGAHHTVEDVGICLGMALEAALGGKAGLRRYGQALVPMDEALAQVALDLSGRSFLAWGADLPSVIIGGFDTALAQEFFQALVGNGRLTLHVRLEAGSNAHHMVEAVFKSFARALRQAVERDVRQAGVPSSKGLL